MKNITKYNIESETSIINWDEGLPLGNGKMGCLIYGNENLKLALDRVDLWDTRLNPTTLEKGFNYKNLVKLVKSGKQDDWAEFSRLFDTVYEDKPYPTKLTAGRIKLQFNDKVENIKSDLSIFSGIANISIEKQNLTKIEVFTSATDFIGVAKIVGDYKLTLEIPYYISGGQDVIRQSGAEQSQDCLNYPKAEIINDGEFSYYKQSTLTDFSYGIVVLTKKFNDHTELFFTVATNEDSSDFISFAKKELLRISCKGYENLKANHIRWWKKYWSKSEINIPDALLEKTYYRSYYLFASCSRKGFYPMPLQGVWTADNDYLPPWKGDYHHDTNTQLSYQSYLKANRLDEGKVFVDYLWNLRKEYKNFAKNFYGVNGLLIPGVSTINGKPMGGWAQYALSPTMTIWVAQSFDEYYRYTNDMKFLKDKAYPFFHDIGQAIYGLLEEKNGKLYLPLSTSPEIFDATREAYLEPNSNFDLSLMIYLYSTLVKYCKLLSIDYGKYTEILNKLDNVALIDNCISLDRTQKLNVSHRHFSHLMALYPLHLINFDTAENKLIYEASIENIEELGSGYWVGFSFAMASQIYAMALNGNAAYEKLRQFADGFVAENGFHLNGDFKNYGYSVLHYRPFTLESSFGFCDALQEMLIQNHQGYIHLFPAIPDKWSKKVSFNNLRVEGGYLVSAELRNHEIIKIKIKTQKDEVVQIKNTWNCNVLKIADTNEQIVEQNGFFVIHCKKGITTITRG